MMNYEVSQKWHFDFELCSAIVELQNKSFLLGLITPSVRPEHYSGLVHSASRSSLLNARPLTHQYKGESVCLLVTFCNLCDCPGMHYLLTLALQMHFHLIW